MGWHVEESPERSVLCSVPSNVQNAKGLHTKGRKAAETSRVTEAELAHHKIHPLASTPALSILTSVQPPL